MINALINVKLIDIKKLSNTILALVTKTMNHKVICIGVKAK